MDVDEPAHAKKGDVSADQSQGTLSVQAMISSSLQQLDVSSSPDQQGWRLKLNAALQQLHRPGPSKPPHPGKSSSSPQQPHPARPPLGSPSQQGNNKSTRPLRVTDVLPPRDRHTRKSPPARRQLQQPSQQTPRSLSPGQPRALSSEFSFPSHTQLRMPAPALPPTVEGTAWGALSLPSADPFTSLQPLPPPTPTSSRTPGQQSLASRLLEESLNVGPLESPVHPTPVTHHTLHLPSSALPPPPAFQGPPVHMPPLPSMQPALGVAYGSMMGAGASLRPYGSVEASLESYPRSSAPDSSHPAYSMPTTIHAAAHTVSLPQPYSHHSRWLPGPPQANPNPPPSRSIAHTSTSWLPSDGPVAQQYFNNPLSPHQLAGGGGLDLGSDLGAAGAWEEMGDGMQQHVHQSSNGGEVSGARALLHYLSRKFCRAQAQRLLSRCMAAWRHAAACRQQQQAPGAAAWSRGREGGEQETEAAGGTLPGTWPGISTADRRGAIVCMHIRTH